MLGKVAIVGWGMSEQPSAIEDSRTNMIYDTTRSTMDRYGVPRDDLNTVIMCANDFYDGHTISNVFTVEAAGAYLKDESKVEQDGVHAMIYAAMRIASGVHDVAMVVAYSKGSEFEPSVALAAQLEPCIDRQYLFLNDVTMAAFQARASLSARNLTDDALVKVAQKNLANGAKNPMAMARENGVSEDAIRNAPMLFDPLNAMTTYPVTDGCCVMILASEKYAEKYTDKPVWIKGMGINQENYSLSQRDLTRSNSCAAAAKHAYATAGISNPAKEIGVAEVSEMFAHQEILFAEALGLCPEGEGGKMLESGKSAIGGDLPINPSGGALSACALNAVGLIRASEAAMQIRGEAGDHQVDGVKVAVAQGQCGPAAQNNAVVVLAAE